MAGASATGRTAGCSTSRRRRSRSTPPPRRSTGCRAWTGVDVALPELNGAQRQRRMIDAGATPVRGLQGSAWTRPARRTRHRRRSHDPAESPASSPRRSSRADRGRDGAAQGRRRPPADARHPDQPRRPQGRPGRAARRGRPARATSSRPRQAIDGARALLPLLEAAPRRAARRRSRTRCRGCRWPTSSFPGGDRAGRSSGRARRSPDATGPAASSGRLWVPGQ